MRLTLNLPDGLLERVMDATGDTTKTAAIIAALEAYERLSRQARLRALRGQATLLRVSANHGVEPRP